MFDFFGLGGSGLVGIIISLVLAILDLIFYFV
jgi:hypothetical protein